MAQSSADRMCETLRRYWCAIRLFENIERFLYIQQLGRSCAMAVVSAATDDVVSIAIENRDDIDAIGLTEASLITAPEEATEETIEKFTDSVESPPEPEDSRDEPSDTAAAIDHDHEEGNAGKERGEGEGVEDPIRADHEEADHPQEADHAQEANHAQEADHAQETMPPRPTLHEEEMQQHCLRLSEALFSEEGLAARCPSVTSNELGQAKLWPQLLRPTQVRNQPSIDRLSSC